MSRPRRGVPYDLSVFVLVATVLVVGAGALSIIFRGDAAFPVRVFGSAEEGREEGAAGLPLRAERPSPLRRGSLDAVAQLRFVDAGAAPAEPRPLRERARVWAAAEAWDRALPAYERLVAAHPDDPDLALERARALAWSGQPAAAGAALLPLAARRPADVAVHVEAARFFWWAGEVAAADSLLSEARARGELDPEVAALHAQIRGAMTPTVRTARRWLAERAGAEEHLRLARAYVAEERYAEAIPHYRQALDRGGAADSVYLELAGVATAADSAELAIGTLRDYLSRHPGDREVRTGLARALGWEKRYAEAVREYESLLRSGDDPELRFEMGQLLAWDGREEEAIVELRRVAQERPRHAPTFRLLGDLLRWRGDWELALASYHHAFLLDPEQEGIFEAIAEAETGYRLARLAARPVRLEACTVGVESFADSEGFRVHSVQATRVWQPDWGTLQLRVRQELPAGPGAQGGHDSLVGYGASAEAHVEVTERVRVGLLLGTSQYGGGGAYGVWGASVEHSDLAGAQVSLRYVHQPALHSAQTLAALEAHTTTDRVELAATRAVGSTTLSGEAEVERLGSDLGSTQRFGGTLALEHPVGGSIRVGAGVHALATRGDDPRLAGWGPLYWAPERYLAAELRLGYRAPLGEHWSAGGSLRPGYAWIREREGGPVRFAAEQTPTLGIGADLAYRRGRWAVEGALDWSGAVGTDGYRATTLRIQGTYLPGSR